MFDDTFSSKHQQSSSSSTHSPHFHFHSHNPSLGEYACSSSSTDRHAETTRDPNPDCQHHRKILELRKQIAELQETEQYLMSKNDDIMGAIQRNSAKERKQQDENQVWRKKYYQLRSDNDRKALRLTSNAIHNSKQQQQVLKIRERQNSTQNIAKYGGNQRKQEVSQMLTKQEKEYVRQLQQEKRQRSNSVKSVLTANSTRKYSAVLPDGLVVHIVDDRPLKISLRQ